MKPTQFPEQTVILAKEQPEYLPLPVHCDGPVLTSCWKLSIEERLRLLWTGRLWVQLMTFGQPLQPLRPTTVKPEMLP